MSDYMPDIEPPDRDALASYDRLAEDGPEERYTVPSGYVVCGACDEIVPENEAHEHACPDADTLAEIES